MRPWLDPVFDAAEMGAADRWAIEEAGVPSLDLMETAGRAVADLAIEMARPGRVVVVCGKGNNAGDGLVAARYLAEAGVEVEVSLLWPGDSLSHDALVNLKRLGDLPVTEGLPEGGGPDIGLVIDAILGTGFEGEPRSPVTEAIQWINASGVPVLSCDVPSGVDASTGEAELAVGADRTVTFHGAKVGHYVRPGKELSGEVRVAPIGIPAGAPVADAAGILTGRFLDLLPERGPGSTKFTSGRVSLVGGSRGLTGAVILASRGAIRAGAGYATAAVPDSLEPWVSAAQAEVMTLPCPEGDAPGRLGPDAMEAVLGHCEGAGAVVLGSGMGRDESTGRLVRELVPLVEAPLVIDADALSLLGEDPGPLAAREHPTVVTPHAGEMGRLLGRSAREVEAHRLSSVREQARRSGAVVVLKGDDTLVCGLDELAINDLPAPALATAGTGDVLAGVCGAFLARGLDPFEAAAGAVFVHSGAGRIAAELVGSAEGVIASDIVRALPDAMRRNQGVGRAFD